MSKHYLIMYYPPRQEFANNATDEESAAVSRHFAYLKKLNAEKTVVMAGRIEDARFGICLLQVENESEAQNIMQNDPAVQAGVFSAELLPFMLALNS